MHDQEPGPEPVAGVSAADAAEALQRDLYVRHRAGMVSYAISILHDADTAEDVIELVFLKLFRGNIPLTRIDEPYLRTAVRNGAGTCGGRSTGSFLSREVSSTASTAPLESMRWWISRG